MVFNDGTDAVLIYAAQNKVYAVLAASGDQYMGWSVNPVAFSAENTNSISSTVTDIGGPGGPTDLIFIPTISGGGPGNIHALNILSGAEVWNLADIVGNVGLEAGKTPLAGYINNEGFFSGAAFDRGIDVVWANSSFEANFPAEG